MKKRIFIFLILCCFLLTGFTYGATSQVKATAHEIAELARSLNLPEDDPIIVRAQELWWEAHAKEKENINTVAFERDRDIIATVVFNEAGYGCSDRHMELVAAVICNRVNSSLFPNTVYDVVVQKAGKYYAYLPAYADPNSYYGQRARNSSEWEKCQNIATKALLGQIECPDNVVYQANFKQGSGVYDTHKTSYSITYFCYA